MLSFFFKQTMVYQQVLGQIQANNSTDWNLMMKGKTKIKTKEWVKKCQLYLSKNQPWTFSSSRVWLADRFFPTSWQWQWQMQPRLCTPNCYTAIDQYLRSWNRWIHVSVFSIRLFSLQNNLGKNLVTWKNKSLVASQGILTSA